MYAVVLKITLTSPASILAVAVGGVDSPEALPVGHDSKLRGVELRVGVLVRVGVDARRLRTAQGGRAGGGRGRARRAGRG